MCSCHEKKDDLVFTDGLLAQYNIVIMQNWQISFFLHATQRLFKLKSARIKFCLIINYTALFPVVIQF